MNKSRKCQVIGSVDFIPVQKVDRKKSYTEKLFLTFFLRKATKQWRMKFFVFPSPRK